MGIYQATEDVVAKVDSALAGHLSDVGTAANKSLDTSFEINRRARAESIKDIGSTPAQVGVWFRTLRTTAASQTIRKWLCQCVIDYTYRGQERREVAEQVELATDAIMRVVDDLTEDTTNTIQAAAEGGGDNTVVHDIGQLVQSEGGLGSGGPYAAATRVEFTMLQRETLT